MVLLLQIIDLLHLSVSFVKVKGHSGNQFNDMADDLTSIGPNSPPITLNPHGRHALGTLTFNTLCPLDSNLRRFVSDLFQARIIDAWFNSSTINNALNTFSQNSVRIDWVATQHWLKFNAASLTSTTSEHHSALSGFKLKSLHHLLPSGDRLRRNFPQHIPPSLLTVVYAFNIKNKTIAFG
ncbi:hypothetical protein RclHR1_20740002 [Rhizophagus clarus]|uniref:Ribonuclease H-like domain-containing protein n=1 Tax=Rhizophagus clarus TaxID=94130 RepID=A0A2Z6QS71_9GLOM|nr:hypothetical protein RclHR1_20740002 [Rhizophagus clarus]GES74802.1 ribonuclease H-like domain-containing protein [Rhizophagus clarus]